MPGGRGVAASDAVDSFVWGGFRRTGPPAQLAKRRADNADAGGSSPPRPTSIRRAFRNANRSGREVGSRDIGPQPVCEIPALRQRPLPLKAWPAPIKLLVNMIAGFT